MSEAVELSTSALLVLSDLRETPKAASIYPPDDLEELRKVGFVRDLASGAVSITQAGLDHLMPPGKPRPYVPPVTKAGIAPPPIAKLPAPVAASQGGKLVGSSFVIAALKKAGGSSTRDTLNADGRTLRKLEAEGQVTITGDLIRLVDDPKPRPAPVAPPAAPALAAVTLQPPTPEPVIVPTQAEHACAAECTDCPTGRALQYLIGSSPALRAMVERFQAVEADKQRLHSFDN